MILNRIFALFFRWEVIGRENIPASGGVMVAANHVSLWDPPVIGTAMSREIHFMAKEELFANSFLAWLIRKLKAFPVKRGVADRAAIRTAIALLENGEVIGLFPEGTRSKNGQLGAAEPGAAMIAIKAKAAVVPTAVIGTNRFGKGSGILPQFKIVFGKPIYITKDKADKEMIEELSIRCMSEIAGLLKQHGNL
jgi:1-acyl-sn-glycerol-3-phosphate acyltransferase